MKISFPAKDYYDISPHTVAKQLRTHTGFPTSICNFIGFRNNNHSASYTRYSNYDMPMDSY